MRLGKLYRRLAVVLVVLAGLGVVADVVALQVAESKAAAGFAQATAAEKVTTDLGGFPFLTSLLFGHIRHIKVDATGLTGGGLRVAQFHVEVSDVTFSPSGAIALIGSAHAARTKVTASQPFGRVTIQQNDLQDFLKGKYPVIHDVRITSGGIEVTFEPSPGVVSPPARFLPRIEERKLVLTFVGSPGLPNKLFSDTRAIERSIDLPPIPAGMKVDVHLSEGVFRLEASGPKVDLLVGEGGIRSA